MNNRCAYCHGKFGLVRHRRAFKPFCSKKCIERHKVNVRTVQRRRIWLDCLLALALLTAPAVKHST